MSEAPVQTAIIGVGAWGVNAARDLKSMSSLVAFATKDSTKNTPEEVAGIPRLSVQEIAASQSIRAVCIATPTDTHAEMVRLMLENGKHVLCEKPLAHDSAEADTLSSLAREKKLILVTGYVFLYHPLYRELKSLLSGQEIETLECVWKKYGTFSERIEMNLLTHHLAIAFDLFGMPMGGTYVRREAGETSCDILETELDYGLTRFYSRIDRLSEQKEHMIRATLKDGTMLEWSGDTLRRNGSVASTSSEQPLAREIREFLDSTTGGDTPLTAGDFGAGVLRVHELIR